MSDVNMRRMAVPLGFAFVGGLAIGGLTLVLQRLLPGAWNQLANSGAVWCVGGFAAGALMPVARERGRGPAVAGFLVLCGEVIGYYASTTVFLHDDLSATALRGPLVWLLVACMAGPVFGLAGWAYRDRAGRSRLIGTASLGAIFIAEAIYTVVAFRSWAVAVILVSIGIMTTIVLGRTWRDRRDALVALVPLTLIGAVAEGAVFVVVTVLL